MNFRKLTILTLVFLMSGVVGLFSPTDLSANDRAKRRRESREIRDILKFQKNLKKLLPHTFDKRNLGKSSEPTKMRIRA